MPGWTEPAATFGYFQKIADLEAVTLLRPLIRRPTGGGLVLHANDWTYSLIVPPGHIWYELRAEESYAQMHRWLQAALAEVGVATKLAPCGRKGFAGQCFAGYEKHDLLCYGRKLAGAAQRRNKLGLLIQGSIQPPPPSTGREPFQRAMIGHGNRLLAADSHEWQPAEAVLRVASELARDRYLQAGYNRRR